MKLLNFGSLNIDKVYSVKNFVQPGETILSLDFHTFCGGKGLNQSVALARAGACIYHAGAVGTDGSMLTDLLARSGVRTDYIQILEGSSGHAIIEVNEKGQNRIIVCSGTNGKITQEYAREVLNYFEEGDILLMQNEISSTACIMALAHQKGMRIALNPSPVNEELYTYPLEKCSWLILNETEGQLLAGIDSSDEQMILNALGTKYPHSAIVLTLGSKGAYYMDSTQCLFQPAYHVPTMDTTAAGDTFCGYLLACLSKGASPREALETAARASAIAVGRQGAAPSIPTMEEVQAFHPSR